MACQGMLLMAHKNKDDKKAYMKRFQEKHREELNAYQRQWRSDHPQLVKIYAERYWKRKLGLFAA